MNNTAWIAYLNTLPLDHRELAQYLMERVQTVINADRNAAHDEAQRAIRRSDRNAARIDDLTVRLDMYEEQRARDVTAELERFAQDQLPVEERDRLIAVLHNVVARLEQLENGDDTPVIEP